MRHLSEIIGDNALATLRSYQAQEDLPRFVVVDTGKFVYQVFTFDVKAYAYVPANAEKFGVHQHAVERAINLYANTNADNIVNASA